MKSKCRSISNNKAQTANQKLNKRIISDLPNLVDLEKAINSVVIGQEQVVRAICTKIYETLCFPQLKTNILLVGKSGTGKTEIIRQLSQNLNIPFVIEDSTRYTEEGYIGGDIRDMITHLLEEADWDIEKASRGIIFIDEIDKKTSRGKDDRIEVSREGVLKGLLKMVEGTHMYIKNKSPYDDYDEDYYEDTIKFDTSNVIFIFGGAFVGLDKIREKRLKQNVTIGFSSPIEENHIVTNNYMNTTFTKEDLIEYGLLTELVGRIQSIYETRELQVEDLKKILSHSKKSEFRKYKKIFKSYGMRIVYSENLFQLIAENAKKTATGARELNSIVSYIFERIMYDILSNERMGKYTKCVLDDEIVKDNTKYHWE